VEALATVDDLAAYLRQPGGAAGLDQAAADLALASASGAVRDYCGWNISVATETLTGDGDGSRLVSLPTLCLRGVTEVRVLTWRTIDPGTFTWSRGGQLICISGVFPPGLRNVEADVTHGYDETPDGVKLAVLIRAARQYTNPLALTSRNVGGVAEVYAVTDYEAAQLGPYRLP
jgi:hypothetical protein